MIALDTIRTLALALPGTVEGIHFKLVVFGIGKRNFATFDPRQGIFSLRLPHSDPGRMAAIERNLAAPVPGKYGAEGWASVDLDRIEPTEFVSLLEAAHGAVASAPAAKPRTWSAPRAS